MFMNLLTFIQHLALLSCFGSREALLFQKGDGLVDQSVNWSAPNPAGRSHLKAANDFLFNIVCCLCLYLMRICRDVHTMKQQRDWAGAKQRCVAIISQKLSGGDISDSDSPPAHNELWPDWCNPHHSFCHELGNCHSNL